MVPRPILAIEEDTMKLDNLDNCPQCSEHMREGERLCRVCLEQEKIDNMTDADYLAASVDSRSACIYDAVEPSDSDFSHATYQLVDIMWKPDEPYSTILFRGPGPGEYKDTPFKTLEFAGWEGTLVAKHVNDWFISQARTSV